MHARFCDETEFSFSWIVDEVAARCSHALTAGGRVWIVDPVAWPPAEKRIDQLGEPAGVLQLLDRHNRDSASVAERLRVPHHVVPRAPIEGAPFEFRSVIDGRWWKEVALWWPEPRLLVCAETLGTANWFRGPRERVGVHALLRPFPPRRPFDGLDPLHVLFGHGEGVHGEDSSSLVQAAFRNARRGLPRVWLGIARHQARRLRRRP